MSWASMRQATGMCSCFTSRSPTVPLMVADWSAC